MNDFLGYEWVNPVYWTLVIEFQFYLLLIFAYPMILRKWGRWGLLFIASAGALLFNNGLALITWAPLFMIGIASFLILKETQYLH